MDDVRGRVIRASGPEARSRCIWISAARAIPDARDWPERARPALHSRSRPPCFEESVDSHLTGQGCRRGALGRVNNAERKFQPGRGQPAGLTWSRFVLTVGTASVNTTKSSSLPSPTTPSPRRHGECSVPHLPALQAIRAPCRLRLAALLLIPSRML